MFTGIVNGTCAVAAVTHLEGMLRLSLHIPPNLRRDLELGASVAVDGVCLTVTELKPESVNFDVIIESIRCTTLALLSAGDTVNVERALTASSEVGGHQVSGHVDTTCRLLSVSKPAGNWILNLEIPQGFHWYIRPKGYVALNGVSLTVGKVEPIGRTFKVYLIPETLGRTTFAEKKAGDLINLEIDRSTQVLVDTVRQWLEENREQLVSFDRKES